ncbi:MAG: DUF4271 domain-containing protein [Saprospiraceae bacterium]
MKRFLPFILSIASLGAVQAQRPPNNPFELRYRTADADQKASPAPVLNPTNPFELRARPSSTPGQVTAGPSKNRFSVRLPALRLQTPAPDDQLIHIRLWFTIGLLVLLTFLLTLFRNASFLSCAGFFNDNYFFQAYRNQQGRGILPFIALYLLFPLNLGSFMFFTFQHYHISLFGKPWLEIGACIAFVAMAMLLKHTVLAAISALFSIPLEVGRYNFLIIIFGVVIGLLLSPVNILLAFGPEGYHAWLVPGTLAAIALFYLFRFLRGVLIANKFLLFHRFHFLLYICTVEIAPVLNFVKLISGWNEI